MKLVLKNTKLVFASAYERVMTDGSRSARASAGSFIPSAPLKVGTTIKSIKIVPAYSSITVAVIKFNSQPVDGSPYTLLMDEQTFSVSVDQINTVDISALNIHVDSPYTYLVVSNLRYSPEGDETFLLRDTNTAKHQSGCNNLCLGWTW